MASNFEYPAERPELPHVPAKQVVLSAAALWLCYFMLITVRGLVVELGEFNELLWRRALVTLAGIAVTLLAWPLLRRFDGRNLGVRVGAALVIMLPAALALAVVNQQAFAPVEQRMLDKAMADSARHEADASASSAPQQTAPTVRVRHDVSGNVLIDVMDPPEPPAPSPRVVPPEPPAPPAPSSTRAGKAPPVPPAPPEMPVSVRKNKDGSSEMVAPGGVVIRHNADGTADVVAGGMSVRVEGGDADEIAANIEEARQNIADAQANARRDVEEARREAEAARREALADAPPPPAPPAPKPVVRAAKPVPHQKAQPAPVRKVAASPSALPVPDPSPSPSASPSRAPQPSRPATLQKSIEDEGLWRQLTDVALGRYFLLIAWAALYLALGNGEMARAAERREGEYRRAAKAAELRSLRYQVNPHFLFNTLNSLSALVMVGRTEQAERMIQTISSFYRHSLAGDPTTDVPLADEIALQRHYLEIEAVRFPERLRTEFEVPKELETACVPGMILQPLVENSIKYAVSASTRPVTLRIAAREVGGLLVLTVADDGPGKPEASGSTGIGLANVRSRLAARFGDRATVESGPLPAGGYATVLTLPVVHNEC